MHGYQMEVSLMFALKMLGARAFNKMVRAGVTRWMTDDDSGALLPFCDVDDA